MISEETLYELYRDADSICPPVAKAVLDRYVRMRDAARARKLALASRP